MVVPVICSQCNLRNLFEKQFKLCVHLLRIGSTASEYKDRFASKIAGSRVCEVGPDLVCNYLANSIRVCVLYAAVNLLALTLGQKRIVESVFHPTLVMQHDHFVARAVRQPDIVSKRL